MRWLRAFGGAAYQAEQAGATVGQQLLYGTASAATSLLVEKISNVGGLLSKAYGKGILDKALANAASRIPARMLKAGLGEGFEEILEAILDPIWQRLIYDKTASLNAQEILYQGLIGAILGFLAGSARNVDTRNPQTAARQLNEIAEALPAEIRPAPLEAQAATVEQVEAKKDEVAAALEEYQKAVKARKKHCETRGLCQSAKRCPSCTPGGSTSACSLPLSLHPRQLRPSKMPENSGK